MTASSQIDNACARAPGKVILLGEHAVVYGRAALAAAIDRHVTVRIHHRRDSRKSTLREPQGERMDQFEFEMEHPSVHTVAEHAAAGCGHPDPRRAEALVRAAGIVGLNPAHLAARVSTNLPLAMGLGSSAALSVALVRALACLARRRLDADAVCAAAFEIEKIFHGFPSGIDNTVATYGGLIAFTPGLAFRPLAARRPLPLVIALGRRPRRTVQTVTALRRRWEANRAACVPVFDAIAALVTEAERAIATGSLAALGAAMNANHALLQRLEVSADELDVMVGLARTHGALGAKLTGGGGGGAVICLCDGDRAALVDAFTRAGWQAFATDIGATQRGAYAGDSPGHLDAQPLGCV
jgi:hydroxymethylglutaryl-CoA reductase